MKENYDKSRCNLILLSRESRYWILINDINFGISRIISRLNTCIFFTYAFSVQDTRQKPPSQYHDDRPLWYFFIMGKRFNTLTMTNIFGGIKNGK